LSKLLIQRLGPITALDVTTQVECLAAFCKLIRGRRTTALCITHDLAVVA